MISINHTILQEALGSSLLPFPSAEEMEEGKLSNLPKDTQLVRGRGGNRPRLQNPCHYHLAVLVGHGDPAAMGLSYIRGTQQS